MGRGGRWAVALVAAIVWVGCVSCSRDKEHVTALLSALGGGLARPGVRNGALPDDGHADGTAQSPPLGQQRRGVRRDGGGAGPRARLHQHRPVHLAAGTCVGADAGSAEASARAGVTCRVLVDPWARPLREGGQTEAGGAGLPRAPVPPAARGREPGAQPPQDHRRGRPGGHHRGLAIQDEWLGEARNEKEWRDTNARVEGPVVAQLQQAFAENWQETTGELLPASDFPTLEHVRARPGRGGRGLGRLRQPAPPAPR